VTFTLPKQWRGLCYGYQKTVFNALFKSAADTLASFFNHDKQLGAQYGCCIPIPANLNFIRMFIASCLRWLWISLVS